MRNGFRLICDSLRFSFPAITSPWLIIRKDQHCSMSSHPPSEIDRPASYGRLAVVGAGAWGTALAIIAAGNAAKVLLWAREREVLEAIVTSRQNKLFLSGVVIPETVEPSLDIARVAEAEA